MIVTKYVEAYLDLPLGVIHIQLNVDHSSGVSRWKVTKEKDAML